MSIRIITGDALTELRRIPDATVQLVVTSPPYNIGKEYEKRQPVASWVAWQREAIMEAARITKPGGSVCWQLGNHVEAGRVTPLDVLLFPALLDAGLTPRNRIVWAFGHGAHCERRYSGRYETVLWFTKGDDYLFDLDAVRVPQLWPGKKYFRGPKRGQLSGNPLGKNPGDVWDITNVKNAHPEKTAHPCQFPEELIERLVSSLTVPGDMVCDPFSGSGTVGAVCKRLGRDATLIEIEPRYVAIAESRISNDMPLLAVG